MLIHEKHFKDLDKTDLESLIQDQVAEGKYFEYKRALPGNSDRDKKEFLADISSFSNSAGGYVFYGIDESNGLPVKLVGLGEIDPDAQILRFENLLRDAVAPRLPGINIRAIDIENNGPVLSIHISQSWASPHMVTFAGDSKFFCRNSAGKYQLDVFELRTAFNATHIVAEQLRNFRNDRIGKIISSESPVKLKPNGKVMLQIIPLNAFVDNVKYDLNKFQLAPNREKLAPIGSDYGSNLRFNFDGILTFEQSNLSEPAASYLQLFRNGIIESADTSLFYPDSRPPFIDITSFEEKIIEALKRFFIIQNILETEPPYFILLSLIGVHGYIASKSYLVEDMSVIDRNELIVPEIIAEDISLPVASILRPAFDAVWNAMGQPQSQNYDAAGTWSARY